MKKDIQIPEISDVYIAVVYEFNATYNSNDWNAYIINNKDIDLEMVMIVTKGFNESKETPVMRHTIKMLPARSYAKIEYLQDEVLKLNNEFKITFFEGNQMFDKTYVFRKNTVNTRALQVIPLMKEKGVLKK